MKAINLITLALVIIGGLNWGLLGLADFDLVAAIFGGQQSGGATLIYILVGISALWQLLPFFRAFQLNEPLAEANARVVR